MFWMTGILGLALVLSPFLLGFSGHGIALWTSLILGAIAVVVSLFGATSSAMDKRWMNWVVRLAGVAAIIAPFAFSYANHAQPLWSGVSLGAILIVLNAFKASDSQDIKACH